MKRVEFIYCVRCHKDAQVEEQFYRIEIGEKLSNGKFKPRPKSSYHYLCPDCLRKNIDESPGHAILEAIGDD